MRNLVGPRISGCLTEKRNDWPAQYPSVVIAVDDIQRAMRKVADAGGRHAQDPMDHGFMYGWSFYDLDGHHWEVFWMDPAAVQK